MTRKCHQPKNVEIEHISSIINKRDIFTKEMKDNTHFINLRDPMMVSLQVLLKYSHNVPTHITSAKKNPSSIIPSNQITGSHYDDNIIKNGHCSQRILVFMGTKISRAPFFKLESIGPIIHIPNHLLQNILREIVISCLSKRNDLLFKT